MKDVEQIKANIKKDEQILNCKLIYKYDDENPLGRIVWITLSGQLIHYHKSIYSVETPIDPEKKERYKRYLKLIHNLIKHGISENAVLAGVFLVDSDKIYITCRYEIMEEYNPDIKIIEKENNEH